MAQGLLPKPFYYDGVIKLRTQLHPQYDIAIIGGGPAGAFSGYLLAQAGFRVTLFEARSEIKRKVCGEYLCPSGVALLKAHHFDSLVDNDFQPLLGMKLISPKGKVVKTTFPVHPNKTCYGVSVNRKDLDTFLLEEAKEAGASPRADRVL